MLFNRDIRIYNKQCVIIPLKYLAVVEYYYSQADKYKCKLPMP